MAILVVAFSGERAQAATVVWDGGGGAGNANWDTANNWDNNSVPGSADDITFATGFGSGTSISLNSSRTIKSLTITATTDFSLNNNTLTISTGNITRSAAAGTTTINNAIALGNNGIWDIAGNLSVTGVVSGSRNITKTGTGTLTLSGANTYSGGMTISGGTVAVGNNAALGTGTLKFQGGTGTLMSASSTGYTLANLVEMHQDTTISGTGALNFSGSFILKDNNHLLTIDNTAVTTFSGAVTTDADRTLTINVSSGSGGAVVSGAMQDSGVKVLSVTKAGGGTLTLSGNNTYTGRTTISGGTLLLAAANRIADSSPMTLSGGIFNTGGFNETVGALTLTANSVIDLGFSSGILKFAASNGLFTSGTTLSIYNWTSGSDHLFFGSNSSSLNADQLGQINFYSDGGGNFLGTGTFMGTQGELVPIPEPTAVLVALGVLGLIGWRERRRMRPRFAPASCAVV